MTKESLQAGYQRYFIAIIPPSPIFEEALSLKNYFKEKYNSKASLNSPPHVTLHMPFLWKEKNEGDLISMLMNFTNAKVPINISLSGFGCFAPRVIFIAVDQNELLDQFQKQLERFCKVELNLFNAQYKDKPFHPHLTLAFRDLKKSMFDAAWNELKAQSFSGSFSINGFDLLKHDGKRWQPIHHFHF